MLALAADIFFIFLAIGVIILIFKILSNIINFWLDFFDNIF